MQPDGTWVVSQLPSDKPVDLGRVRTLINAARSLKLDLPKGRTLDPAFGLGDQARATVFIKGQQVALSTYWLRRWRLCSRQSKGQDFVVLISKFNVSQMMDIQVDQLIDQTKLKLRQPGTPTRTLAERSRTRSRVALSRCLLEPPLSLPPRPGTFSATCGQRYSRG